MRVTIEREIDVGDLLEEIHERYGTREELQAFVEENPKDWDARVALHDLQAYADEDPGKRLEDTREILLPEEALDELTFRRLEMLVRLKQHGGSVEGVRALARALDRDKKNVSQDVDALRELGLVTVTPRGPGRAHRIALPGHRIDLHLLEAG